MLLSNVVLNVFSLYFWTNEPHILIENNLWIKYSNKVIRKENGMGVNQKIPIWIQKRISSVWNVTPKSKCTAGQYIMWTFCRTNSFLSIHHYFGVISKIPKIYCSLISGTLPVMQNHGALESEWDKQGMATK